MHTGKHLLTLLTMMAIASLASAQVVIDFESPAYAPGDLNGQDGWVVTVGSENATATVVATDNGPSAPGGQCLQTVVSVTDDNLDVQRTIQEVVANQGPIVSFQYDIKQLAGPDFNSRIRLYDSVTGKAAIGGGHWWSLPWCQYAGSYETSGVPSSWVDIAYQIQNYDSGGWNTLKWTVYFGTEMGASYGQLLSMESNGVVTPCYGAFCADWATIADVVRVLIYGSQPSTVLLDNFIITGAPLPSAAPTANAGPDQANVPATYDGGVVTLDASGSTDDGSIVTYRWTRLDGTYPPPVVALTTEPVITTTLPVGATHTLRLEVVDDDGLHGVDTCTVQIDSDIAPIDIDNLQTAYSITNGDIFGTAQQTEHQVPAGPIHLELVSERTGGAWDNPTAPDHTQFTFDRLSNLYYITWYRTVKSLNPDLGVRWESQNIGDVALENGTLMIGERYVYVIGAADSATIPWVYAFSKSDGSLIWECEVYQDGDYESWDSYYNSRPKAVLYDDMIYFTGLPDDGADSVFIWAIDASEGVVQWHSAVTVGDEAARPGNIALVPDLYGEGLHGLFFAGRSAGDEDGLSDATAVMIDPASGATLVWGVDAGHFDFSRVIYSDATGRDAVYMVGENYWKSSKLWSFDATTGATTPVTAPTPANNWFHLEATALGFDGATIHNGAESGWIHSYVDSGDGQNFATERRWYGDDLGLCAGPYMIAVQNTDGETVLVTAFSDPRGWWINQADATPGHIVVLDIDNDADASPSDADIDDGAIYVDDVVVTVNDSVVFSDDFESYSYGPLVPQAGGVWTWTGDAGLESSAEIVDKNGDKVLKLDPFGGSGEAWAVRAALPAAYSEPDVVVYTWNQYRDDLMDSVLIGDSNDPRVYEYDDDGYGNPQAYVTGTDPAWDIYAPMTAQQWQACELILDYGYNGAEMYIDGQTDGGYPYIDSACPSVDDVEIMMLATPSSSSTWTPTAAEPLATRQIVTVNESNDRDWSFPVMLSMSPAGDIYYFQDGSAGTRIQRLRIVSDAPQWLCADANCDGAVNAFDIDPFVVALVNETQYAAAFPNCDRPGACDINGDGAVNAFDIDPFVVALVSGGCQN